MGLAAVFASVPSIGSCGMLKRMKDKRTDIVKPASCHRLPYSLAEVKNGGRHTLERIDGELLQLDPRGLIATSGPHMLAFDA